jgi:ABC-type Na+ efflux pump permease subunit
MPSTSRKLSIASLALAIVALAVFCSVIGAWRVLAGVNLIVGAVVTGVVARRRVRRDDAGRGGVALAGIAPGVAAVVVLAIFLAMMVYSVYSGYEEFQHCIRGSGFPKYLCLKECPQFLDYLCRKEIGW